MNLTRRQTAIIAHLEWRERETRQHPPSLQELCDELGLVSRGSLHKHIEALVKAGKIEPIGGRHCGVRLAKKVADESSLRVELETLRRELAALRQRIADAPKGTLAPHSFITGHRFYAHDKVPNELSDGRRLALVDLQEVAR